MGKFKTHIKKLISNSDLNKALKDLDSFFKEFEGYEDEKKELFMYQSEFNKVEKEKRIGTIGREDYELRHNKVKVNIFDILERLPNPPSPPFPNSAIVKIGKPKKHLALGFFIGEDLIMTCYRPLEELIRQKQDSIKIYTNTGEEDGRIISSLKKGKKDSLKEKNIAFIVISPNRSSFGKRFLKYEDEDNKLDVESLTRIAGYLPEKQSIASVFLRTRSSEYPEKNPLQLKLSEWNELGEIELMTGTPLVKRNEEGHFCFYGLVEEIEIGETSKTFSAIPIMRIRKEIGDLLKEIREGADEVEECVRHLKGNIFLSNQREGTWKQVISCIKDDQQIKRSPEVEKTTDDSLPSWEMNIFRSGLEKALTESSAYQSFLKKNRNFLEDWLCWMFLHQYEPDFIARDERISKIFFLYLSLSWIDDKYFEEYKIRDKQLNDIIFTLKDKFVQCFDLNLKTSFDGTKTLIFLKKLVDWESAKKIMLGPPIYWLLCSRSNIPLTELEKNFSDKYWFKLMKNKLKRFQKNSSSTFDASFLSQHELSVILEEWLYLPKLYTIYDYRYANATEKIDWDNFRSFVEVISRLMDFEKKENQDKFEYNTTYQVAFSACPKTGNYDFN